MDRSNLEEFVLEELKSFRSQLFAIDVDDENSKGELCDILDKYAENIQPFAEEYLIARLNVEFLNDDSRAKVVALSPDGELPSIQNRDAKYWDRDRLLFCLLFDNVDIFLHGLELVVEKKPDEIAKLNIELRDVNKSDSGSDSDSESDGDNDFGMDDIETLDAWREISLVKVAVLRELNPAIEQLGALNSDNNYLAIRLVYEFGHWECLRKLLEKRQIKLWKPVKLGDFITFLIRAQTFDKDFRENDDGKVDFGRCVDLLFEYAQYDINEQNNHQYSPLHLAVMYNKTKIIFELLKKGAYIGVLDKMDRPAIWNINAKTLEKYFDQCIVGDDLIVFNFENIISPSEDFPNDMTAIEFISNSSDLKHLLEHPLIASFLFLKWNRLALIFYLDFMCYFILSLTIGCLLMFYIMNPFNHIVKMSVFVILFAAYVMWRRALQIIFCSLNHRTSLEMYINTLLTVLMVVFTVIFVIAVPFDFHSSSLAAICIILITYEFFTLAGTFWHFSIYSEMFIAVAKSSVKSLQLYAIFLPAFSLLFYILLRDKQLNANDATEMNLNKFPSLGSSVVKTIVMSAGEFDVINVNFDANTISIYVFIGFIFLISTVFMNLLNGLAVSDTNKIQLKAELTSFRRRCQVLARYEEVLSKKHHWFRTRFRGLWRICKKFTQFNTFVYQDKRIYIEPDDERIVYSVKVMPSNIICLRVPLRSWMRVRSARMSPKIVHNALQIREKHELKKNNEVEHERNQLMNRIVKIENTLRSMETTLKAISNKLNKK